MSKLQTGDQVVTKWDEWDSNGKQMVVPGEIVSIGVGHARSKVYGVMMSDTGKVEKVFPGQIV